MSTKFLSPGWRMPRNANQSKNTNYSMNFSGSNYIDTGFVPKDNITSAFTFSAWVNASSVSSSNAHIILGTSDYVSPYGDFIFGITRVSYNYFYYYSIGGRPPNSAWQIGFNRPEDEISNFSLNTWHHLVFTYDGTNIRLYNNGSLVSTRGPVTIANYPPHSAGFNGNSYIGGVNDVRYSGATQQFTGKINEVAIFDYAVPESQVATLYGTGSAIGNPMALSSPPIAYYPLDTSAWDGNFLAENNAIGDYVFNFYSPNVINTGNSLTITKDLTLSGWVKFTATNTSSSTIISKHISGSSTPYFTYQLYIENNGAKFRIGTTTYTIITGNKTNLNDGKWHHILGTYDGSNINLYVDGVSDATAVSASGNLNTAVKDTTVGAVIDGGTGSIVSGTIFLGNLSNIKIFNKALSAPEVETLYNYGSPIKTLANIPQNSNLKAWYKLDASEIYNSTSTKWEINQATADYTSSLSFPGVVGDLLKIPNSSTFVPTSNLTFSFWVNHTTTTSSRDARVFSIAKSASAESMYLMDNTDGTLRFTISNSAGNSDTFTAIAVNDGKWHNVVCTWDASGNIKVYTDNGTPSTNTNTGTLTIPSSTDMGVGGKFTGTGSIEKFAGLISNGSVWNKALSASEVSEVYNSGQPSNNLSSHSASSNLVAWWKMDNLTTGIQDSSTNSNNGTAFDLSVQPGSVSTLNGESTGMTQSNLVQSDLQTVAPYSKYAMNFDIDSKISITTSVSTFTAYSVSVWINVNALPSPYGWSRIFQFHNERYFGLHSDGTLVVGYKNGGWTENFTTATLNTSQWYHLSFVDNGTNTVVYINAVGETLNNTSSAINDNWYIANNATTRLNAKLSNVSIWNTALTQAQVTEIYNEGLPSNLNSHSAYSNLVSWWQLGSNSSFNTNWTVLDEKGSNNGTSANMIEANLTNGVGTTANGVSSGMAVGALVGDAPYSNANAISSGMSVVSRVSGVSDATITTGGTGYSTGTNIATTGGSGTNCTINITTVSGGAITAITINSGGNNYLIGDVLTVSGGNGNATITVSGLNTP